MTISGANTGGTTTASVPLEVRQMSTSYTSSVMKLTKGRAMLFISPIVTPVVGVTASFSVSPKLPLWLTVDSSTGTISGTPSSVISQSSYTIFATNAGGGSTTYTVNFMVNDVAPSVLAYSTEVAYYAGAPMTYVTPSSSVGSVYS